MAAQHSVIFVRSIDRIYGNSSAFTVTLPQTFNQILGIQLLDAAVPIPYNISGNYGYGVNFTVGGSTVAFTLINGNYAVTDLITYLQAFLQTNFTTLGTVTITYSSITGCLSIAWTGAAASLNVQNTSTNGLGVVIGTSVVLTAFTLVSGSSFPYIVNLAPVSTLFLQLTNLNNNIYTTAAFNAMFRIQTSANPGAVNFVNNSTNVANNVPFNSPVSGVTKFDCLLVDQNNQAVQLGGQEWTFSVGVTWTQ